MGKINKKDFRKAVKGTGGIITQIAKKLGCERLTVYKWIEKNQEYAQELLKQEREKIIDVAENSLFIQAQNKEMWATKYILSTIGKSRGYVEKQEVEHSGSAPISINIIEKDIEEIKKMRKSK